MSDKSKSISVRGITYRRFRDLCQKKGVSMRSYLEQLLTERLDREGVEPNVEKTAPKLELWECNLGPKTRYIAATSTAEANRFLSRKLGMDEGSFKLVKVERDFDETILVPGVLPPDEEREVLKSMEKLAPVIQLPVRDDPGVDVEHEQAPRPSRPTW